MFVEQMMTEPGANQARRAGGDMLLTVEILFYCSQHSIRLSLLSRSVVRRCGDCEIGLFVLISWSSRHSVSSPPASRNMVGFSCEQ